MKKINIIHPARDCPHSFCFTCGSKEFVLGAAVGVMSTLMFLRLFW